MNSKNQDILFHRVSGTGHPVVFLHGFLESSTMWDFLDLPESIQKIVIDLPGHGASVDATEESTMKSMAKLVLELLKNIEVTEYTIVGHSMGGYVGLELMKLDEGCAKLVLLNSNFWKDSPDKVENRKRVANVVRTNKSYFLYETIPNLFLNPDNFDVEVKGLIDASKKMKSENISRVSIAMSKRDDNQQFVADHLEKILIIQGAEDLAVPKNEMDKKLRGLTPNYVVLKNTGHMTHIELPVKTTALIASFISR
ncbi:MAG: alpha/beta hydrolase [Crocinitomicaceae bacterium]|nr:alpha/beta hydrolase [Crocinitomicaceae bacterium]MDG1777225.1 alpha/beta hydrolase [Crocinitomicaceae bacterium]